MQLINARNIKILNWRCIFVS